MTMGLEVIGAGFGRTGTMSLKLALEKLGHGPCYHMIEAMKRPAHDAVWQSAADGRAVDWDRLFDGFRSAVDWPAAAFWPILIDKYPRARVILTTRDPESWFRSMSSTIFQVVHKQPDRNRVDHRRMVRSVIVRNTFENRTGEKGFVLDVFRRNTARALAEIRSERLLHYRLGDGWEPLCAFLGVSVPDEPFPHVNDSAAFRHAEGLEAREPLQAGTRRE